MPNKRAPSFPARSTGTIGRSKTPLMRAVPRKKNWPCSAAYGMKSNASSPPMLTVDATSKNHLVEPPPPDPHLAPAQRARRSQPGKKSSSAECRPHPPGTPAEAKPSPPRSPQVSSWVAGYRLTETIFHRTRAADATRPSLSATRLSIHFSTTHSSLCSTSAAAGGFAELARRRRQEIIFFLKRGEGNQSPGALPWGIPRSARGPPPLHGRARLGRSGGRSIGFLPTKRP